MTMHDPRKLIFRALFLDAVGQLLILVFIVWISSSLGWKIGGTSLESQSFWLLFSFLLYPSLGWLFGSYTVLSWRRLSLLVLVQRLAITAVTFVFVVAFARWLINPSDHVWLIYRRVQFVWMFGLFIWSVLVRLALRRGLLPNVRLLLSLINMKPIPFLLHVVSLIDNGFILLTRCDCRRTTKLISLWSLL